MFSLYLEHILNTRQVSWLTDHCSLHLLARLGLCNGSWSSLPAYSDQFAPDSHRIPSSGLSHVLCKVLHLIPQYSITHHEKESDATSEGLFCGGITFQSSIACRLLFVQFSMNMRLPYPDKTRSARFAGRVQRQIEIQAFLLALCIREKKCLLGESRQHIWELRTSQKGLLCFTRKLNLAYKAGFLTSESSLGFPFSHLRKWCNGINEASLLCYSDRIAQDLHLIPSSAPLRNAEQHSVRSYGIILKLQ